MLNLWDIMLFHYIWWIYDATSCSCDNNIINTLGENMLCYRVTYRYIDCLGGDGIVDSFLTFFFYFHENNFLNLNSNSTSIIS